MTAGLSFPLRAGTSRERALICAALREAGFEEATLCLVLKIPNLCHLGRVPWRDLDYSSLPVALQRCASLFLFGESADRDDLDRNLGLEIVEALLSVGLLRPRSTCPAKLVSSVFLYPVAGFVVTSDRHDDPDGEPGLPQEAHADVVFPAIFGGTLRFIELLPDPAGGDALDLCGGSGIGALCLARGAARAVTADITDRSTRFARFNAWLNDCGGVEAVCGDLYEPLRGRQFGCITAHPPYVPSLGDPLIYRDAGPGGEDITRSVVAGLPEHLRPGGRALILCQGRDAEEGAFERRVRAWLGQAQADFDVVFAVQESKTPEQEVQSMAGRMRRPTRQELAALLDRFRKMGTRQFVYGALYLARHGAGGGPPWTARVDLAPEATALDFERLVAWGRRSLQAGFSGWLAESRPRLAEHFEVQVRHGVEEGTLVPREFIFRAGGPFPCAMRFDGWVAPLAARFDGTRTPAVVYEEARAGDALPAGFEFTHFLDLVALLVTKGYLTVPEAG